MNAEALAALITAIFTSIVGPIAVHYAKAAVESRKKKKDPLSESIMVNHMITEKLEKVREQFESDRIWLLQFHNGGHFYPTGKSIQKFSMVYELLSPSVVPCQHQFQNIPVSLFSKAINQLHSGNTVSVISVDPTLNVNGGFTTEIAGSGVRSSYIVPIFNIKGEFVGIVGMDYVEDGKELTAENISDLGLEISTIGGVLNDYLKG